MPIFEHNFKVIGAVIVFHRVDMMNLFPRFKKPPKNPFHYKTVFSNIAFCVTTRMFRVLNTLVPILVCDATSPRIIASKLLKAIWPSPNTSRHYLRLTGGPPARAPKKPFCFFVNAWPRTSPWRMISLAFSWETWAGFVLACIIRSTLPPERAAKPPKGSTGLLPPQAPWRPPEAQH